MKLEGNSAYACSRGTGPDIDNPSPMIDEQRSRRATQLRRQQTSAPIHVIATRCSIHIILHTLRLFSPRAHCAGRSRRAACLLGLRHLRPSLVLRYPCTRQPHDRRWPSASLSRGIHHTRDKYTGVTADACILSRLSIASFAYHVL